MEDLTGRGHLDPRSNWTISKRKDFKYCLGGPVVKNLPANAGDTGLIPGQFSSVARWCCSFLGVSLLLFMDIPLSSTWLLTRNLVACWDAESCGFIFFCFYLFCILLAVLWNLRDLNSPARDGSPCPLHWKYRVLTTGPPGTSSSCGSWCIHREGGRWEFSELQPGRLMWNILEFISNQVMLKVEC